MPAERIELLTPPTSVPFVALGRQNAAVREALGEAFDRVLMASSFILGEEVERFEAEFAAWTGVEHCVGVASGTAALTLTMVAAGIGPGDEVIVPGHTYIASALAVVHAGATPVFCDVEMGTGLIDAQAAAEAITDRTAAILAVHLYGQVADIDALGTLARARGLHLFEDAAQAHGASYRGRPAGSLAHAAAFSFYPSKNLGALGDGGAICTDDAELADRARRLRNLGQRAKGEHVEVGFNERLDGLQAALLRVKLPHVKEANHARREHAEAYRAGLTGQRLLQERDESPCVFHLFPLLVAEREALRERLLAQGVQTGVHYAPAAHRHAAWAATLGNSAPPYLPAAEAWAAAELSLPMFPELEPWEIQHVIERVAELAIPVHLDGSRRT